MSRYYSESDSDYNNHDPRPDSIRASGWQSPSPASLIRIDVESPFGSRKYDYSIDKSQRGHLVVTARRQRSSSLDYRSSTNKNYTAIQTFTIPVDADVDHLESHIEHNTNRLIIEIPRQKRANSRTSRSSNVNSNHVSSRLIRSPDIERMLTSPTFGPQLVHDDRKSDGKGSGNNRKLEYRIDCRGYRPEELEVFIQGRDLIIQGETKQSNSSDPMKQSVSKKFSRKIALPHTVDLAKVVSHLENGELRIEAPLKRGVSYHNEEIILPGPPPSSSSLSLNRPLLASMAKFENRVRSPSPNYRHQYRQNERTSRRRDYDYSNGRQLKSPTRRVRSVETIRYPLYKSPREIDEEDSQELENGNSNRKDSEKPAIYTTVNSPTTRVLTTRTTEHRSKNLSDEENDLKF